MFYNIVRHKLRLQNFEPILYLSYFYHNLTDVLSKLTTEITKI